MSKLPCEGMDCFKCTFKDCVLGIGLVYVKNKDDKKHGRTYEYKLAVKRNKKRAACV